MELNENLAWFYVTLDHIATSGWGIPCISPTALLCSVDLSLMEKDLAGGHLRVSTVVAAPGCGRVLVRGDLGSENEAHVWVAQRMSGAAG